jgi:hypothetical protein
MSEPSTDRHQDLIVDQRTAYASPMRNQDEIE